MDKERARELQLGLRDCRRDGAPSVYRLSADLDARHTEAQKTVHIGRADVIKDAAC